MEVLPCVPPSCICSSNTLNESSDIRDGGLADDPPLPAAMPSSIAFRAGNTELFVAAGVAGPDRCSRPAKLPRWMFSLGDVMVGRVGLSSSSPSSPAS